MLNVLVEVLSKVRFLVLLVDLRNEMSAKTKIVSVLMLGFVAVPGFSQNTSGVKRIYKNTAELEKTKRTMQGMAMDMSRKGGNSWQSINTAPSFPLPLFRGNQTTFYKPPAAAAAFLENSHNHNITMQTRDPAANVYQFYESTLRSSGFTLDPKLPRTAGKLGRIFVMRGESPTAYASVSIAMKDDAAGPASQISITVVNKPAPAKK